MLTSLLLTISLQLLPSHTVMEPSPGPVTLTVPLALASPEGLSLRPADSFVIAGVVVAGPPSAGLRHQLPLNRLSARLPALLSCIFSVNDSSTASSDYPASLKASSEPDAVHYQQQNDYYALRYSDPEVQPEGAVSVLREGDGAIAIFQGQPPRTRRNEAAPLPVYSLGSNDQNQLTRNSDRSDPGPAVVPTGEVFIRFSANIKAQDRAAQLRKAGYEITRVLDFAPQGAWVHSSSGSTAESLQRLSELEGLAGMEKVEPQMLMERRSR